MIAFVRVRRPSFTLVELLVVIAIIGVLTALIVGVAAGALGRARWARIKIEVDNLAGAVEAYKTEFGEYPPDFNDLNLVRTHMRRRYPRWNGWWPNAMGVLDSTAAPPSLDEAQALVFWLRGHSKNPLNPFDTATSRTSFFDFKPTRLLHPTTLAVADFNVPYPIYVPDGGQNIPFVYFNATSYVPTQADSGSTAPPVYNLKMPYMADIQTAASRYDWINPTSFQILSAGPDGDWGNRTAWVVPFAQVTRFPSGTGYIRGDMDNATNFSPTSLEAARP